MYRAASPTLVFSFYSFARLKIDLLLKLFSLSIATFLLPPSSFFVMTPGNWSYFITVLDGKTVLYVLVSIVDF